MMSTEPVARWLDTFDCKQYAEYFHKNGFSTLSDVCKLSRDYLVAMGIGPADVEKIVDNVSVLRQTLQGAGQVYGSRDQFSSSMPPVNAMQPAPVTPAKAQRKSGGGRAKANSEDKKQTAPNVTINQAGPGRARNRKNAKNGQNSSNGGENLNLLLMLNDDNNSNGSGHVNGKANLEAARKIGNDILMNTQQQSKYTSMPMNGQSPYSQSYNGQGYGYTGQHMYPPPAYQANYQSQPSFPANQYQQMQRPLQSQLSAPNGQQMPIYPSQSQPQQQQAGLMRSMSSNNNAVNSNMATPYNQMSQQTMYQANVNSKSQQQYYNGGQQLNYNASNSNWNEQYYQTGVTRMSSNGSVMTPMNYNAATPVQSMFHNTAPSSAAANSNGAASSVSSNSSSAAATSSSSSNAAYFNNNNFDFSPSSSSCSSVSSSSSSSSSLNNSSANMTLNNGSKNSPLEYLERLALLPEAGETKNEPNELNSDAMPHPQQQQQQQQQQFYENQTPNKNVNKRNLSDISPISNKKHCSTAMNYGQNYNRMNQQQQQQIYSPPSKPPQQTPQQLPDFDDDAALIASLNVNLNDASGIGHDSANLIDASNFDFLDYLPELNSTTIDQTITTAATESAASTSLSSSAQPAHLTSPDSAGDSVYQYKNQQQEYYSNTHPAAGTSSFNQTMNYTGAPAYSSQNHPSVIYNYGQ